MASAGLQELLWQDLFSDPTQWWDNRPRRSMQPPWHGHQKEALWLSNWYKPAWEPQLALSAAQVVAWRLPGSIPPGTSSRLAGHDGRFQVGTCRKLFDDGKVTEAVNGLKILVQQGCHIPNNLFYCILKRCIAQKDLVLGRRIHALTVESGYEGNAFLATHLIGMYASQGRLEEARQVFSKVATPDGYNWASIIFAYARHGEPAEALRLYRQMQESAVKPDNRIFVAVLKACASAGDLAAGKDVHAHILVSAESPDMFVHNCLVEMYAKCGDLKDAREVFDALRRKNVVTWNAMFAGYAQQGMGQEALDLFSIMQHEGTTVPDAVTFVGLLQACASAGVVALQQGKQLHAQIEERGLQDDMIVGGSLVNMYAKFGNLEDARRVFDRLPQRNVVSWTAMIAGYAQQGMGQEALSLYSSMQQEGVTIPNPVTFVCLLRACANAAALPLGKQLHEQIEERGVQADLAVGSSLVNMYAKCGSMVDAQQVFDSLSERETRAWGALIAGYTSQGDGEAVSSLLDRMRLEGIQPDGIIFLSALTVCSHVGLVDNGRQYFEAMSTEYGITPGIEHYTCMMDLLGRAGHLEEALQMVKTMPFPPDGAVWLTLLSACRKWTNVEVGRQAFEFAIGLDETAAAAYVLMSNIYAAAEMWDEAEEMQARRLKSGACKQPGRTWWTDMGGVIHDFKVEDWRTEGEGIHEQNLVVH